MGYEYKNDMSQVIDLSEATKISKYGGGIDQLKRLNLLYLIAMSRRHAGNLEGWRWVLDSIEIELHPDMKRIKKDKEVNWIDRVRKINSDINAAFQKQDKTKQYALLKAKEKMMRWIQEAAGKGTKLVEEEEAFF